MRQEVESFRVANGSYILVDGQPVVRKSDYDALADSYSTLVRALTGIVDSVKIARTVLGESDNDSDYLDDGTKYRLQADRV